MSTRRPAITWLVIWSLLGAALVVRTGVRERGVITDHLEFGRRVLQGEELYAPFQGGDQPLHAPYPPGFGLLTAPFSLLPERGARFAWGSLQVLALWVIGAWLLGAIRARAPALGVRAHWLLAATVALGARYVLRDTHGGGGNLINLALVLSSCAAAARGRGIAAGLLLGFSLATKPTAVLFLPLLWIFGHRRAAGVAVVAALGFTAIALAALDQGLAPLQRWATGTHAYATMRDLFAEPALGFPPFSWMNQSLRCALTRYAGTVPEPFAAQVAYFFPGLQFDTGTVVLLRAATTLLLLAITAVVVVRARRNDAARAPAIAAVLALSLLLSPISWKAHHVVLLPALTLVVGLAAARRREAWAFLAIYALALGPGEDLIGKSLKNTQQSLYVFTAGTLALWGICLRATAVPPWRCTAGSANVLRPHDQRGTRPWDSAAASSDSPTSARPRSSPR